MMLDVGNSWQRKNTGRVTIQRGNKAEAERAAQDLIKRGYEIIKTGTHGDNYHTGFRSAEVMDTSYKSEQSYGASCKYFIVLERKEE